MKLSVFLRLLRSYGFAAQAKRKPFVDAVRALVDARWATVSAGVTDPEVLQQLAGQIADEVVRNYTLYSIDQRPTAEEVVGWVLPEG